MGKRTATMWLNDEQVSDSAICAHRDSLVSSFPKHIVIDGLFNEDRLEELMKVLRETHCWKTQKHTYSALYVDSDRWQSTSTDQRFVQRDVWQSESDSTDTVSPDSAQDFLSFLRGEEFTSVLSRIFNVSITDLNVADPTINTNYFRLGPEDFVKQHADDSPGREICMLLYLNKAWDTNAGGELVFIGKDNHSISIPPLYNRCVLFDPSSSGSEHWVETLDATYTDRYRYNVTSWYWSE